MEVLRNKIAVVTGAASGIGFALATQFAAEGMNVVLADIEAPALQHAVEQVREQGVEAAGVVVDVSDEQAVQALADRAMDEFGAVHVVCNNAGVSTGAPFIDFAPATFAWVMNVNIWGVIYGCRAFLPLLEQQGEGHIVNTCSSVIATGYQPTGAAYATSKRAVAGFTETLYRELLMMGSNVNVSLLVPGGTDTRIPDAERNLPPGTPSMKDHPTTAALYERFRRGGSGGLMDPRTVAELTVQAIREPRFFILTEPDVMIRAFEARVEWMRTGVLPPHIPELEPWGDMFGAAE